MWSAFRGSASSRSGWRCYSTAGKPSVDLKALAELRKRTGVSISKAREALANSNNDLSAASVWLDQDLAGSGAQKLAKLQNRTTNEGVIAISILSPGFAHSIGGRTRAAMIELNCETDFVGRNRLLRKLAADIAHTAAYLVEPSADNQSPFHHYTISDFGEAPLIVQNPNDAISNGESVNDHIRNTVAKMGEKITLRRAVALAREPKSSVSGFRVASYIHGTLENDSTAGRVGTLVDLSLRSSKSSTGTSDPSFISRLETLERALARQIVGLNATKVRRAHEVDDKDPEALYDQEFMMHPTMSGELVEAAIHSWAKEQCFEEVRVEEFIRWKVGEPESI